MPKTSADRGGPEAVAPDLELEAAIEENRATFSQWMETYFFSQKEYYPEYDPATGTLPEREEAIRKRYRGYRDGVFKAFRSAQGSIESSYYCTSFVGAAVLTRLGGRPSFFGSVEETRLHIGANVGDVPIDVEVSALGDLLNRCMEVGSKANQILDKRDRRICLELAFNISSDVLGGLDAKAGSPRGRGVELGKHLDYLVGRVENLEAFYRSAARQRARLTYFGGMIRSLALLVGVGALIVWLLTGPGNVVLADWAAALGATAAGAVGAVVSVMWRMTRGRFRIDYETGTRYLRRIGSFRPALGAIFGLIAYFGISSGVLRIQLEAGVAESLAFAAFVGFFVGFSERLAQDMLTRGESALSAAEDEEEAEEEAEERGRPPRRRPGRPPRRRRGRRSAGEPTGR